MKIRKELTVQKVGGENVILLQGHHGLDTTRIVSLNDTSLWLWNRFSTVDDFTEADVAAALAAQWGIEGERAAADAAEWVRTMQSNSLVQR